MMGCRPRMIPEAPLETLDAARIRAPSMQPSGASRPDDHSFPLGNHLPPGPRANGARGGSAARRASSQSHSATIASNSRARERATSRNTLSTHTGGLLRPIRHALTTSQDTRPPSNSAIP